MAESELSFTDVSGNLNVDSSTTSITLYPPKSDNPQLHGSWNVFGHWGPTDGKGNHGQNGTSDMNLQPSVYPGDTLTFGHRISAMYNGQYSGYDKYLFNYIIDDYLDLRRISVPLQWVDFPNSLTGMSPLERAPEYDIYLLKDKPELELKGTNTLDPNGIIAVLKYGVDFVHGDEIDIAQVLIDNGLPSNTHISQVRYDFTYAPGGLFSYSSSNLADSFFKYEFKIHNDWQESDKYDAVNDRTLLRNEITIYGKETTKPGFNYDQFDIQIWDFRSDIITGKIKCNENQVPGTSYWYDVNNVRLSCTSINSSRNSGNVSYGSYGNADFWSVNGDRLAYVTDIKEDVHPTTANTIEIVDAKEGEVLPGKNKIKATVSNIEDISLGQINRGGMTSYLYIPKAITLDLQDIVFYGAPTSGITVEVKDMKITQGNYNIYEVTWDSHGVEVDPATSFTLEIGVNVGDKLSDLTLHILTHLPNNADFFVLSTSEPKVTDTIKVRDNSNLTGMGEDTVLMKSSNVYKIISDYFVLTEKFVKGVLDTEYSKLGETTIDGEVSYKLDMTNKEGTDITSMLLMDVLPSVDDLGITDSVERGSDFTLVLNGPVKVDDRFTVFYRESKNPKRDVFNNILSKDNFGTITNPLDSEDGNWVEAHEVTDFENIHSFIIVLNEGDVIEVDEKFSIEFTTVVDQEDKETLSKIKEQKVAWNSFAYSVNGKPTVEPLQVGVVITPFVD
ncbi:MAG: hypothetical protein GX038_06540, partial [Erysipelothrix sp.]|nr:hypothetical protein [Erysipelothrix sp.]